MTESQCQKQKAITAPKKKRIWTKKAKSVATPSDPVDITSETTDSESQLLTTERTERDSSEEQNMVTSEETGQQTELGPFSKTTIKKSGKDGPIRKAHSTEIPQRKYYRPMADAKTYKMNGQGQLQCQQDPKDVTRVGSVKELLLCREKPIFHEPVGTMITDKEQLTAMYLNSFDRIGSLKGEYVTVVGYSFGEVHIN